MVYPVELGSGGIIYLRSCDAGITDGRDLLNMPLRWLHVA
jgi:hypothetical protein